MALPAGKKFALAITVCFDGQSVWLAKGMTSPAVLARGEYDAKVGVPRVLDVLDKYQLKASWFVPGHSMLTWPEESREVLERGHEIGAHGVYHERLSELDELDERKLMALQLEQFKEVLDYRPRGYRAPFGTMNGGSYALLEEFGFEWHSSLCGRDFEPFYPREITGVDLMGATTYGRAYRILEFATSWYLEDWVAFEYSGGYSMGLSDTEVVLQRWKDSLDYGRRYVSPGVMCLVLHSQCIARPHHMVMLEKFLTHVLSLDDTWIATISDIYDAWTADAKNDLRISVAGRQS